jgi:type IV pilus assembly protein PilM
MALTELLSPGLLPIGIDIGAGGAKLAQLRRRGQGLALACAARVDLPCEEGQNPGSPERLDALIEAVGKAVSQRPFIGRRCVLSLDDRLLRVRSVRQPRMPDAELDRAIMLDAPSRLGFAEGEAAEIAWLRAGEVRQAEDVRDEVLVVGAQRDPIERLVFGLTAAGLRPEAVEPGFVGCARAFGRSLRRAEDQNTVRILVDIGLISTGVIITRGREVAFYKPLEIGGAMMTRLAAERLGLEPDAVRALRRQRMGAALGLEPACDERVDRAAFEAVRPLMGDLAREVGLCLRYTGVTFRGARPECAYVVGGDAAEPQLAQILSEELHLPVSVGRPLDAVSVSPSLNTGAGVSGCFAEYTAAIGLSQRPLDVRSLGRRGRRAGDTAPPERAAASINQNVRRAA